MRKRVVGLLVLFGALTPLCCLRGEVTSSGTSGFQIRVHRELTVEAKKAYEAITKIGEWWSDAHTYTGSAANMSMDFDKGWFQEKLPNHGFVRHLDIVYHQPGKTIRMTGGLGPLQGMGVSGALTISLSDDKGKASVELTYNVSGYLPDGFAAIAPAVDGVLTEQIDRFVNYCLTGSPDKNQVPAEGAVARPPKPQSLRRQPPVSSARDRAI